MGIFLNCRKMTDSQVARERWRKNCFAIVLKQHFYDYKKNIDGKLTSQVEWSNTQKLGTQIKGRAFYWSGEVENRPKEIIDSITERHAQSRRKFPWTEVRNK